MITRAYKHYQRGQRVQLSEENFGKGMSYTNTPLLEGFSKSLINYDTKDAGAALTPRAGLRTYKLGLAPKQIVSGSPVIPYNNYMSLAAGKICTELDNREYDQILIGQPSGTIVANTDLYKGVVYAATVYPKDESYEDSQYLPSQLSADIDTRELHIDSLLTDPSTEFALFKKPDKAVIHGMSLLNRDYIARQVGTFAFNNSYYCFKRNNDGTKKLIYTKFLERTATSKYAYKAQEITPKALTPKEAVMWGYNMLSDNPYDFENRLIIGVCQFYGMLPYDTNGKLAMSPYQNQDIQLRCYYGAANGAKYTFKWEWKEAGAANWISLGSEIRTVTDTSDLTRPFSAPSKDIMVKISAYKWVDNGSGTLVEDTIAEQVLTVGFNFNKATYGATANIEPKSYDLSTAAGMAYWKNRLVVYGLVQDPTLLFMSDVNNPEYFPYPNNTETFDEPIMHAMAHLDSLLVFTTTKLYILTLNADGLSWTRKCIQNNLAIQEWDIHLIKPVKNMVFFKSGNYYYMVVPVKSSTTGELTVAPISKSIETFLDTFEPTVQELLQFVYYYKGDLQLVHYYNFLDYEDVHNVYVFKTDDTVYVNLSLLYNITERSWRIHITESQHILVPFRQDATKKGILTSLVSVTQNGDAIPAIQFLQFNKLNCADFYIPQGFAVGIDDLNTKFNAVHFFKNYQLIDTGYREHISDYKKRYREIQFKINNLSQESLSFYTDFLVDGDLRRSTSRYELYQEQDPTNPNYGVITMERIQVDPTIVPGSTLLADTAEDVNLWTLDSSLFPEAVLWKIRIPVSGKGYSPRMRFISFNEKPYELLNTTWVYRPLNSR